MVSLIRVIVSRRNHLHFKPTILSPAAGLALVNFVDSKVSDLHSLSRLFPRLGKVWQLMPNRFVLEYCTPSLARPTGCGGKKISRPLTTLPMRDYLVEDIATVPLLYHKFPNCRQKRTASLCFLATYLFQCKNAFFAVTIQPPGTGEA